MVSVNLLAAWDLPERDMEGGLMEMCLSPECVCSGVHICWLMECSVRAFGRVWGRRGSDVGHPMLCGLWSGGYAQCQWGIHTGEGRGAWGARGQDRDIGTTQLSRFRSSQGKGGFNPSH